MVEPQIFEVTMRTETKVRVVINDPDVIERVTGPNGDEWRADLYPLHTLDDVLNMLADNCVRNNVRNVYMLDGWGDCDLNAATMEVVSAETSPMAFVVDDEYESADDIASKVELTS